MFGTERMIKWRTKGNKSGSIRKYTDNNLGSGVSVDQLQSDQLVLVPKFSGKLTSFLTHVLDIVTNLCFGCINLNESYARSHEIYKWIVGKHVFTHKYNHNFYYCTLQSLILPLY